MYTCRYINKGNLHIKTATSFYYLNSHILPTLMTSTLKFCQYNTKLS